jgi:hypothetical protein
MKKTSRFEFTFCNSFGISKIIRALGNTAAVGNDHVPISVYKNGVNVLAGPVSHLVYSSLSSGKVPKSFKGGIIIPVYKGHGKNRAQASLYRPVSLLLAVSKVLEVVLKESLEKHLAKLNAIRCSQFGFWRGRSCTMALSTAQGEWLKAVEAGSIVDVLAFDLSAAFDTLDPAVLLPKLEALGILGRPLTWFTSYLNGGSQIVDWAGLRSSAALVKFGVRQGSILGPLLFLIHVADLPDAIRVGMRISNGSNSNSNNQSKNCTGTRSGSYADDSHITAIGRTVAEVVKTLNEKCFLGLRRTALLSAEGKK